MDDKQKQIDSLNSKITELTLTLQSVKSEELNVKRNIRSYEDQILSFQRRLDDIAFEVTSYDAQIKGLQDRIDQLKIVEK